MHTVNDIFDKYVRDKLPLLGERTQVNYKRHIASLRRTFGAKLATELTLDDLNAYMDVEKGKIHRTREMTVMAIAFGAAVKWRWIDYNIAREVKRHKAKARKRHVTDRELAGIKKIAGPRLSAAIDLARLTALLQGTITTLRWDQVHEDERRILARNTRTGKQIEVPISNEVQAVLDKCRQLNNKKKSDYVVPNRFGTPYTHDGFRACWQRVAKKWKRAGHDPFTFNDITMTAQEENKRLTAPSVPEDVTVAGFSEFDPVVRSEATRMAQHYKVFYCLEKSIRGMISEAMRIRYGADWWNSKIDPALKQKAEQVLGMEIDSGLPQRSDAMIDYTTFGQLRQIIAQNWADVFSKKLSTEKAVSNVMTNLNRIRGPIAHFSSMSEHDVERLRFACREWFNLLLDKGI